jgi:cyanophycin synthetase
VQLGQGVYQQRIRATMTSKTGSLAVDVAGDKEQTNRLLAAAGLPVPKAVSVRAPEDALAAAGRIGFPVVVKPLDGNHGRGVQLDLRAEEEVAAAFPAAQAEARRGWVVVESFVHGNDYRVLVIGGKMVAVAERVPAHVTGDGTRTVAQLVEETNADPRRGVGHEKVLTRIRVDDAAVELVRAQGFELDDVPPKGTTVKLTLTGNMSTGGISIDRTDEAHPDNVEIAEEAARVVGLDIAGIDFIAPDIAEPVRETGGAIVEVNGQLRRQRRGYMSLGRHSSVGTSVRIPAGERSARASATAASAAPAWLACRASRSTWKPSSRTTRAVNRSRASARAARGLAGSASGSDGSVSCATAQASASARTRAVSSSATWA